MTISGWPPLSEEEQVKAGGVSGPLDAVLTLAGHGSLQLDFAAGLAMQELFGTAGPLRVTVRLCKSAAGLQLGIHLPDRPQA